MVKALSKIEKLTSTIQDKLDGNPLILVGSGGSIPYGLPSMNELAVEIVSALDSRYISSSEWVKFKDTLSTVKDLELALASISLSTNLHDDIINTVWNTISKRDSEAYRQFLKSDSQPSLVKIIKKYLQRAGATNIVTTNYDKIIEYSVDFAKGDIRDGFTGQNFRCFDGPCFSDKRRTVNIFKVHGSIDWFKNKKDNKLFATNAAGISSIDEYIPMIVTPGNEKYRETHYDPFRTIMSEADRVIKYSTSYLCIGYGFNDEHIQQIIINENRDENKPIVIITKNITDKMRSLFHNGSKCNCVIISENSGGGSLVSYSSTENEVFSENIWKVDEFYRLWME